MPSEAPSEAAYVHGLRGGIVETTHTFSVAVVRPDGSLLASAGNPRLQVPLRSTAKPFQAIPILTSGAANLFGFDAADLALACASHQGTPAHTDRVQRLLDRLRLPVDALKCGSHPPMDSATRDALTRTAAPTQLHNNCSGKHAGMLATALALGANPADYLASTHPIQRAIRDVIVQVAGTPHFDHVIDGCSAPCWVLGLHRIARMYAALAAGDHTSPPMREPLGQLFDAMRTHPEMVGGPGVLDTTLMHAVDGLVAKRGADGCYALAVRSTPHGPIGIALKVDDGSGEARTPAVIAVLDALGVTTATSAAALTPLRRPSRINHRGLVVGAHQAHLSLTFW
ncbi:MAG: L-asparaginase II [Myxococcota bacterium]|jgi:L-asparaginase II